MDDLVEGGYNLLVGVPGENDNDRRLIDFCAESNTYFEYRSLHKYTRVAGGQDGGKVRSVIDLVLVKKAMLRYMEDVRAVRGMERVLSDHHVVL